MQYDGRSREMRAKGLLLFVRSAFSGRWRLSPFPVDNSVNSALFPFTGNDLHPLPVKRAKRHMVRVRRCFGIVPVYRLPFHPDHAFVMPFILRRQYGKTACSERGEHALPFSACSTFCSVSLVSPCCRCFLCTQKNRPFVAEGRFSETAVCRGADWFRTGN